MSGCHNIMWFSPTTNIASIFCGMLLSISWRCPYTDTTVSLVSISNRPLDNVEICKTIPPLLTILIVWQSLVDTSSSVYEIGQRNSIAMTFGYTAECSFEFSYQHDTLLSLSMGYVQLYNTDMPRRISNNSKMTVPGKCLIRCQCKLHLKQCRTMSDNDISPTADVSRKYPLGISATGSSKNIPLVGCLWMIYEYTPSFCRVEFNNRLLCNLP